MCDKATDFTKDYVFDNEQMISIKVTDFDSLMEDRAILKALRDAGVDNWEGFEIAMEPWVDD